LKAVRPTAESDAPEALRDAVLKPRIQREFLQKYNNAKFPKDLIAENVLIDLGLPKERSASSLQILKANATFAGLLLEINGDKFVDLGGGNSSARSGVSERNAGEPALIEAPAEEYDAGKPLDFVVETERTPEVLNEVRRVFITHGRNLMAVLNLS
jgi:hypothetical protein